MNTSRRRFAAALLASAALVAMPGARSWAKPSIPGRWYYQGQACHIEVVGHDHIKLRNNEGRKGKGTFQGPWVISVPDWGVTGAIQSGGTKISWSNGTVWTRYPDQQTHISGQWYHGKRPTSVRVYDNGWGVDITNEDGDSYKGHAQGSHGIVIPAIHVTGTVSYDGQTIDWSNGTQWTRKPTGGGKKKGPFTSVAP